MGTPTPATTSGAGDRRSSPGARLRELFDTGRVVIAPGAMNALFGRLVEQAGFPAVYMTGAGVANGLLGQPDVGLTTQTEMAEAAGHIAAAVSVPVIADADTGFGGVLNVERTVRLYEAAGVAAIQLEDQVLPKRCGHFPDKEVVGVDEMCARVQAACGARRDPDLVVIARTDARAALGLDEAIDRCRAYAAAGADALFLEAPEADSELERIGRELGGLPLVANVVEGGKTPLRSADELARLGFRLVIFPGLLTRVAVRAARDALEVLARTGDSRPLLDRLLGLGEVNALLGLDALEARASSYEQAGRRGA